ncbi:pilus assembly protein [Providencia vermicola]|uniref:Pilus assembly protein n=2 Tax=Providencia TaxID=586 RepID=A0AAI9I0L5_PROST|nr:MULTISPECIES: pilus assembly protein [Providencia]ELR5036425.1 pilus assembly protein [Providencia stuartii]ELR5122643.1 pilus assembly protein [Providencia stuartii]ELR5143901.1 pilus assembly protein [Providencia stuartii]ELX8379907.1 pilus assembly protein [Providencia stuartii]ELZ5940563.1 pilus assembly protein [Providencia stuartii]
MMKKVVISSMSLVLLATVLLTENAQAKTNNTTITFKAAIVQPPCSYDFNNNNVQLNCFNSKENKTKKSNIHYSRQSKTSEWKQTTDNRGIYQFKWTNKERNLAMISVQYL